MNLKKLFQQYIAPVYTTSIDNLIFISSETSKDDRTLFSHFKYRLKKDLLLLIYNQFKLVRKKIEPRDKKILWILNNRPIGDFLMYVSGRALFKGSGHEIHLFSDEHFRGFFTHDDVITKFISNPDELNNEHYDLILTLSFTRKLFKHKLKYFRDTPFATTDGYLAVFHNETLYSFYSIGNLLGLNLKKDEIQKMASPYIISPPESTNEFPLDKHLKNPIAIALGGKVDWKVYNHWEQAVKLLDESRLEFTLILIGSDNGLTDAEKLKNLKLSDRIKIIDQVGKISLYQTFLLLKQVKLLACVDGGLFHLANAAGIPTVSLFSQRVFPKLKLTEANNSIAFHSTHNASEIPAESVADAIISGIENPISGLKITLLDQTT